MLRTNANKLSNNINEKNANYNKSKRDIEAEASSNSNLINKQFYKY